MGKPSDAHCQEKRQDNSVASRAADHRDRIPDHPGLQREKTGGTSECGNVGEIRCQFNRIFFDQNAGRGCCDRQRFIPGTTHSVMLRAGFDAPSERLGRLAVARSAGGYQSAKTDFADPEGRSGTWHQEPSSRWQSR